MNGSGGGVISNKGNLTITGGVFQNNVATGSGGGAIMQYREKDSNASASLIIQGDTANAVQFVGNRHALKDCAPGNDANNPGIGTNSANKQSGCNATKVNENGGGGAIRSDAGIVKIIGGVSFERNRTNATGWMVGGGAVYVLGELWVLNSADGVKPVFDNNWATVGADSATITTADGKAKVPNGSAGGAIFLEGLPTASSRGYIMGGEYKNNVSGYLGGAIYTEEYTTSYVGRALMTDNSAGHFGGGLWLCPSGNANASEGGNAAIYGNKVDENIDANAENLASNAGFGTTGGDDFAMMNPAAKALDKGTTFTLLKQWFSDRAKAAVTWYWDGTSDFMSNGFADSYQGTAGGKVGVGADHKTNLKNGTEALKTNQGDARFEQRYDDNTKVAVDTPLKLYLQWNKGNWNSPTKTWGTDTETGYPTLTLYTGVGFKAIRTADADTAKTENSASMTLKNNQARLSGGAFGSNGVVMFSTPYGVSWSKVSKAKGEAEAQKTDQKADNYLLKNSAWELTTTDGGPLIESMRPAECRASDTVREESTTSPCWTRDADGKTWVLPYAADNGPLDTNPTAGRIDLDNLAPGTYRLTEVSAPHGYKGTTNVYEFTIELPKPNVVPDDPPITLIGHLNENGELVKDSDGNGDMIGGLKADPYAIGNVPATGRAAWGKFSVWANGDSTTQAKPLGGSEWKVTLTEDASGKEVTNGTTYDITDCTKDCPSDNTALKGQDTDAGIGDLSIKLDVGTYKLIETKAPDGYWLPDSTTVYYTFTVHDDAANGQETELLDANGDPIDNHVENTPRSVSWRKISGAGVADPAMAQSLVGSEWTVQQTADASGTPVTNAPVYKVVDSKCGTKDCLDTSNTEPGADGKGGVYTDRDVAGGQITIAELGLGTYVLRETKAPFGYKLPDDKDNAYTFAIADADYNDTTGVQQVIQVNGNNVVTATGANARPAAIKNYPTPVAMLPFTGGSALDWLMLGGGIAVVAAALGFGVNEYRRRRAAMM